MEVDQGLKKNFDRLKRLNHRRPGDRLVRVLFHLQLGEKVNVTLQLRERLGDFASPLQNDQKLLNGLREGRRGGEFVDDRLHRRFVLRVAVEQRRPLFGRDTKTSFQGQENQFQHLLLHR